ncbi:MAG: hypothetical protein LBU89_07615 [Fibromonadaceae bacterium]|jgi:hypothetical protein|nr:hypothetical protein [Fibromonadaceae bacterium]
MNFEDNAMNELSAAILSIDGPYIDISNPNKLYEQEMPLSAYSDIDNKKFPIVLLYIDGEVSELVANDRFEISVNVNVSIIYKINPRTEKKPEGLERGRQCLKQIVKKILERQKTGEALTSMYLSGSVEIQASDDRSIDHKKTTLANGIATAKFTLRHIEPKEE